jgi:hypothetical protein
VLPLVLPPAVEPGVEVLGGRVVGVVVEVGFTTAGVLVVVWGVVVGVTVSKELPLLKREETTGGLEPRQLVSAEGRQV